MNSHDPGTQHTKIFNIGFHKTGTTSLTQFMRELNLRTLHSTAYSMERLNLGSQLDAGEDDGIPADLDALIDRSLLHQLVSEYDFFSDNPWPLLFRQLDTSWPGSKFILTRRNTDCWINSLLKYSDAQRTRMRKMIYGYGNPENHIKRYRQIYLRHNRDVISYFGNKDNLLVIDIEDDNRSIAVALQEFLGLEEQSLLFPNINKNST